MEKNNEVITSFNILANSIEKAQVKGTWGLKEAVEIHSALNLIAKFIESTLKEKK